jgi:hypothetical protein
MGSGGGGRHEVRNGMEAEEDDVFGSDLEVP